MRTTIKLNDELLADAKRLALQTGKTLSSVIEDSLRKALARRAEAGKSSRIKLPRTKGSGLQSGVNLDSNADLLELMENDYAPH